MLCPATLNRAFTYCSRMSSLDIVRRMATARTRRSSSSTPSRRRVRVGVDQLVAEGGWLAHVAPAEPTRPSHTRASGPPARRGRAFGAGSRASFAARVDGREWSRRLNGSSQAADAPGNTAASRSSLRKRYVCRGTCLPPCVRSTTSERVEVTAPANLEDGHRQRGLFQRVRATLSASSI